MFIEYLLIKLKQILLQRHVSTCTPGSEFSRIFRKLNFFWVKRGHVKLLIINVYCKTGCWDWHGCTDVHVASSVLASHRSAIPSPGCFASILLPAKGLGKKGRMIPAHPRYTCKKLPAPSLCGHLGNEPSDERSL